MYAAQFDYYRASSVEQALTLLGQYDDAKLLAGGHSLLPMMKLRLAQPGALIDIGRLAELKGISRQGDTVRIGSLTTHAELAASETLQAECPLIAQAAAKVGDLQVRNKGTLGGNVAHADPASDLPAALVASGATVCLRSTGGERRVPAADFFTGLLTTDLREGELLTAVEVPVRAPHAGACYLKLEHPASGYAICGAAALVVLEGGKVTAASLAFNGVTPVPLNASAVADALVGGAGDDGAIDAAVDSHLAVTDALSDVHASAEYRVHLARVYGKRALEKARDRARA